MVKVNDLIKNAFSVVRSDDKKKSYKVRPKTSENVDESLLRDTFTSSCPCLMSCDSGITESYFVSICNSAGYEKCHQFARMMDTLKAPMKWLQHVAIKKASAARARESISSLHTRIP